MCSPDLFPSHDRGGNRVKPDIVFCPFLKEYLPKEIFENYDSFILHPGIIGDRGHNSLDHAINNEVKNWGVVILKATQELDAGDIYAQSSFEMRIASKASIYRNEVNKATLKALEEFLINYQDKNFKPIKQGQTEILRNEFLKNTDFLNQITHRIETESNNDYRDWETDRKSTRLNSSHITRSRMPSSA